MPTGTDLALVTELDDVPLSLSAVETLVGLVDTDRIRAVVVAPRGPVAERARSRGLETAELDSDVERASALRGIVGGGIDLVHAVGTRAATAAVAALAHPWHVPLVVTPDRLLRTHRLPRAAARARQRVDQWLVHGRLTAHQLVRDGAAPSGNVTVLPLLPLTRADTASLWATRAEARRRLGIPPGVRVVAGAGRHEDGALQRFRTTLAAVGRADVQGLWFDLDDVSRAPAQLVGGVLVSGRLEAAGLAPAADLVLAVGGGAPPHSLVVDAIALGVRAVASADDVAADLVLDAGGRVTQLSELPGAVLGALTGDRLRSVTVPPPADVESLRRALVAATRCAYTAALRRPLRATDVLTRRHA